jgi:AcrR family transcriptional regulator
VPTPRKTDPPAPKRRPASGGYLRGEEQKDHIIAAALKVFGDEGYERASTRMIASAAGIQPPALQYYFGGKEGLHLACTEYVIARTLPLVSPALQAARSVRANASATRATEALCTIVDALVDASVFIHEQPNLALFAARAQREDTPGAALMREKISLPFYRACAQLVAKATGGSLTIETRMRTTLILAQMSAFHAHRGATLRNLRAKAFSPSILNLAKRLLRQHIHAALEQAGA